jgi:Helicase
VTDERAVISEALQAVGQFSYDPLGLTMMSLPWKQPGLPLEDKPGPRAWQGMVMKTIHTHLTNKETRHQPLRIAVSSGHGIGKSALVGMLSNWAMSWPQARVMITANTEQQLTSKTSPEVAKWMKMSMLSDLFNHATMKISSKEDPDGWRLDFVTWSATNTEAFAGLHNLGNLILIMTDESAAIDDKVWEVIEGALTDENTVLIWIALGNPTRNVGRFRECFGRYKHLWKTAQIDARDVEGTNKEYLQSLVDTYGIDSDIVKVRVLGQFPSASSMQFIGTELVEAAMEREHVESAILASDPVIFGLDHARFGDDASVLAIRQGRDARSRTWLRWQGANSMEIASSVNEAMRRHLPDAVFVDAGGPNAGGVIDRLRQLNHDTPWAEKIFEINFGSSTRDMTARGPNNVERVRVANKRAQMWQNMKVWLDRALLPPLTGDFDSFGQRLRDDLIGPEYSYNKAEEILLEKKEHMKARGLASPDYGDALALTFAEDVAPREVPEYLQPEHYGRNKEFDRYAELEVRPGGGDYDRYQELR